MMQPRTVYQASLRLSRAIDQVDSPLVDAIVPGQLHRLETVFEVCGLQLMGLNAALAKRTSGFWKGMAPCQEV